MKKVRKVKILKKRPLSTTYRRLSLARAFLKSSNLHFLHIPQLPSRARGQMSFTTSAPLRAAIEDTYPTEKEQLMSESEMTWRTVSVMAPAARYHRHRARRPGVKHNHAHTDD
jgi:hypothetical protein